MHEASRTVEASVATWETVLATRRLEQVEDMQDMEDMVGILGLVVVVLVTVEGAAVGADQSGNDKDDRVDPDVYPGKVTRVQARRAYP